MATSAIVDLAPYLPYWFTHPLVRPADVKSSDSEEAQTLPSSLSLYLIPPFLN